MSPDNTIAAELQRHLLQDEQPSQYLNDIACKPEFTGYPYTMLLKQRGTEQSPVHHPEGTVWNHTLLVVDEAAKVRNQSKNPTAFMWAALLHDIGKPDTTQVRKGKITSYDHEKVGERLAREFLSSIGLDAALIDEICGLVRYHMQILYVVNHLRFADIEGMREHTDIREIALLGRCDRLGRIGYDRKKEEENIRLFLTRCNISDPFSL